MQNTLNSPHMCARPILKWSHALTAAALALMLSACDKEADSAPHALKTAPSVEVVAHTVNYSQVPISTELTGRVVGAVTAEIRPQTGGIVRKRLFEEGSQVKAGQVLYTIDSASSQTTVRDAEATLSSAKVGLANAKATAARYRALVEIEAVSRESADEAEAAYQQAISEVESAEANLDASKISLSYANVTSPINGRIGRSSVSEGALVTENQTTALATVQQLDPIYLDATQSATEFVRIRQQFEQGKVKLENGDPIVRMIKDDGSLYEFVGTLGVADAIVDQTTGTVTVRSQFPNPKSELLPGMYGKVRFEGAVIQNALVVPQVAISRDVKGNAIAYVVNESNTIEERALTTGSTLGDQWIVESGLEAGERVVVEGLQKIRVGSKVTIAGETHESPISPEAPTPAGRD